MVRKIIASAAALCFILSGCSEGTDNTETVFSLTSEQQDTYSSLIEEELNSFYWLYDENSLSYYDGRVPDYTEENRALFDASEKSGYDLRNYCGREAVVYSADLTHFNSEKAGIVYFYFIRNNIVGLFYNPAANPEKFLDLNTRNAFTPEADFIKYESESQYTGFTGEALDGLNEGFCSSYVYDGGSFIMEMTDSGINIYRYRGGAIRRHRTISSSQLEYMRPISSAFSPEGGIAVIVGEVINGSEGDDSQRLSSRKVLFFDSSFNKLSFEIELVTGTYSCVSFAKGDLVLLNDKNTELYRNSEERYEKYFSYYTNIQATDFKEADIDKNGENEYIITDGKDIYIYKINDGSMECLWRTNVSADCYYGYIYTGDLNRDGVDEIYICDSTGTVIRYVLQEDSLVSRNEDITYGQRIYACDFDGDGNDDYIFYNGEESTLYMVD